MPAFAGYPRGSATIRREPAKAGLAPGYADLLASPEQRPSARRLAPLLALSLLACSPSKHDDGAGGAPASEQPPAEQPPAEQPPAEQPADAAPPDDHLMVPPPAEGTLAGRCAPGNICQSSLCSPLDVCLPLLSSLPPQVVQTVPPPDIGQVPASLPVVLFLDGAYPSLRFEARAWLGDTWFDVTPKMSASRLTTSKGNDLWVVAPIADLPLAAAIEIRLLGPIVGRLVFATSHQRPGPLPEALGFEKNTLADAGADGDVDGGADGDADGDADVDADADVDGDGGADGDVDADGGGGGGGSVGSEPRAAALPEGWAGLGDVGCGVENVGDVWPREGHRFAAMSTGTTLWGQAAGETSSGLVSGPIEVAPGQRIAFAYTFQSAEFDDFCGSPYDDTLLAVAMGPLGSQAMVLASVNLACSDPARHPASFPGMPDMGDPTYLGLGWREGELGAALGSPVRVAFVLTDVGDRRLSSVAALDAVRVVP